MRVSIKGTSPVEYHRLTGAKASSYALPFRALEHLITAGVSCNACVTVSFSTNEGIARVRERLAAIRPGILTSLELEHITLFPKVAKRLREEGITPRAVRHRGRIVHLEHIPTIKGVIQ